MLEEVEYKISVKKLYQKIETVLHGKEKEIIKLRYGLFTEPKTQREIAKKLGISRSYVSRIEKRALKKLEEELNKG